jgi:transposase
MEKEPKPYIPKSTETQPRENNYGVDISTLTRMIENGEL